MYPKLIEIRERETGGVGNFITDDAGAIARGDDGGWRQRWWWLVTEMTFVEYKRRATDGTR